MKDELLQFLSGLAQIGRTEVETAFYMTPPEKRLECLEAITKRARELNADVGEIEKLFAETGIKEEKLRKEGTFDTFDTFENRGQTSKIPFNPFEFDPDSERTPFPVHCLPDVIRDIVTDTAESLQVPPDFAAMSALGIISTCIQGKYVIELKPDWREQVNLYLLTIARPSERKSPALQVFTPALDKYIEEENKLREPDIQEYRTRKTILENAIEGTKKKLSGILQKGGEVDYTELNQLQRELSALKEVHPVRLLANNVTPEKLVSLMANNGGKMSIISAEGGIFNILAGQYNDKTNIDLVLQAYTGESFSCDRIGRNSEYIKNPHLTMLLMVQPRVLETMIDNPDFAERGLTARFMYSYPESMIGKGRKFVTAPIRQDSKDIFESLVYSLLKIPQKEPPEVLTLSKEAYLTFQDFFYYIEKRLNTEFYPIEGWAGKMVGNTGRIAANLHCCIYQEQSGKIPVSGQVMMWAVEIAKYFINHSKAVFNLVGAMDTPEEKAAKYILKRLKACGEKQISKRNLFQLCKGTFQDMDEMQEGLTELELRGYLWVDKISTGGRPTETVILNPEYDSQKPQKPQKVFLP